jgi:molecular chaperone GrpE
MKGDVNMAEDINISTEPENKEEDTKAAGQKDPEETSKEAAEEETKEETKEDTEDASEKEQEASEETGEAEEARDAAEEADDASDSKKKKGLFGRKKEKVDKKDEMIADLKDKLTRQMAEFDNFRKRTEKEKAANFIVGAKEVLEKILPVVDNFERGLADADPSDPFTEGMNMVYKQLTGVLADLGVSPIEAVGKPFDPNLHNAVMHVEDESVGENVVVEEFQKGYIYKDQVLRHSMVKVAN